MVMVELKPERLDAGEFNDHPISISGRAFRADYSGALYWPAENALIVADLHLEKGSAFASRGVMLPPYDTRATLEKLAEAVDRFDARTVIALGDSLHDCDGAGRMNEEDLETLKIIQEDREWIWVTGNHDPVIPDRLGGHARSELRVGGLSLRHAPRTGRSARNRRPPPPGGESVDPRLFHSPAVLRGQWTAPCVAGVRHLRGRAQRAGRSLRAAVRPRRHVDLDAWARGLYPVAARLLKED